MRQSFPFGARLPARCYVMLALGNIIDRKFEKKHTSSKLGAKGFLDPMDFSNWLLFSGPTLWGAQPPNFQIASRNVAVWKFFEVKELPYKSLISCPDARKKCPTWDVAHDVASMLRLDIYIPKMNCWSRSLLMAIWFIDNFDGLFWFMDFFMYLYNCTSLYFHMHPVFFGIC